MKDGERYNSSATLLRGDVLKKLSQVENESIDLVLSSPPYNIGKAYERDHARTLEEYIKWQDQVVGTLCDKVKSTGSICWQVGSYVKNGEVIPLDIMIFDSFRRRGFKLRNRIIWTFNFGLNSDRRFSGRYETLLWFTKSDKYKFQVDPVRIPQLYPGKRHSKAKGEKAGLPSGNPRGKNPADVWEFSALQDFKVNPIWDIPNVKANHPEKTLHPCQFPVELAERCILALTNEDDTVLDPFVGTGATAIAAVKHNRAVIGIDRDKTYLDLAKKRVELMRNGELNVRPIGKPIRRPVAGEKVATIPDEWLEAS